MTDIRDGFDPLGLEDEDWEDEEPTPEESYAALRRSIARTAGFGLKFLECTASVARETIAQLTEDLPQKKIAVLDLDAPIAKLFDRVVADFPDHEGLNVLFVLGLERSLVEDISPGGVGGEGDYYQVDRTPRILAHLNQNREKFRDSFSFCFVFVLPRFAKKYFVRRAADFVDWGSGVFELRLDRETIERESLQAYQSGDYDEYLKMTEAERREKRIELQTWIEESDDDDRRSQLLLKLGDLLYASQALEDAVASLDRALEIKPDYHYAWSNRGYALRNLGQNEAAVASYDHALEIKPDNHTTWNSRGIALSNLGQNEAAVASYDRALEIKPDYHYAWDNRGDALGNLGQYEAAVASYDRALEIKPDYHYAWNSRGIALGNLGQYEAAVASFDRALEIKPDYHVAWYNRGSALDDLGQYEAAVASFDRALEIKPDYHDAWDNRGAILCDFLGQYADALASFDRALEIKPDDHYASRCRGIALSHLGQHEAAVASFDRALEIKPDYHDAWNNRGNALRNLGQYEAAVASYDRALEIKSDDHAAWNSRGIILCDFLGRYTDALASFDRALEIKLDDHYAWLNRGVALRNLGRIRESTLSVQKALEINPDGTWLIVRENWKKLLSKMLRRIIRPFTWLRQKLRRKA
jgi:superkiller protein 3